MASAPAKVASVYGLGEGETKVSEAPGTFVFSGTFIFSLVAAFGFSVLTIPALYLVRLIVRGRAAYDQINWSAPKRQRDRRTKSNAINGSTMSEFGSGTAVRLLNLELICESVNSSSKIRNSSRVPSKLPPMRKSGRVIVGKKLNVLG